MKLELFILDKSDKLGLSNENLNVNQFHGLLQEEVIECLVEADKMRVYKSLGGLKYEKQRALFALELMDVIQICIAGLAMLVKDGLDIRMLFIKHNYKLRKERKWKSKKKINISVEDNDE